MNWDASDQLAQSRNGLLTDWHPPVMAAYWHLLDVVVRGPITLLLAQATLFVWGIYRVLLHLLQPVAAAWLAAGLVLFPAILAPMAVTWKDAQMAACFVAGLALALEPSGRRRALGLLLLTVGAAVRDNAPFALPPLCIWIVSSWQPGPAWRSVV
jgi:hypothetical protein